MRRWTILIALGLVAASAYGVGMGAGGFYALSMPMGDIADAYDMCMMGFGGKVMIGVMPMLNVDVGFGYHMKYKAKFEGTAPDDADDYYLTTIPITFGVSYPINFGAMGVYFGGGGAFVLEKFNVPAEMTAPDGKNKPGVYVGGGFKYGFTDKLALDVNPRWMMVLDKEDADEGAETPGFDQEEEDGGSNSMFIDFLIGVDYYFM
jgi:opacity protein-like surface antigen